MFRVICACAVVMLASLPLAAHHGWFDVDWSKRVTVTATVKELRLISPHASIDVEVDGEIWKVELVAPLGLTNRGIPHESLQPGKTLTLLLVPYRGKVNEFRAEQLTVGDKTASLLPPGTKPPQ